MEISYHHFFPVAVPSLSCIIYYEFTKIKEKQEMSKLTNHLHRLSEPFLVLTFLILLCKIFFWGIAVDIKMINLPMFSTTLGLMILLLSPAYFLIARRRKIYLYALNFGVTFLIIADLLYFRYFATPMSVYVFMQSSNLTDLGPSIFNLIHWTDFIFLIDLVLLPILFCHTLNRNILAPRVTQYGIILGLFLALFFPAIECWQNRTQEQNRFTAHETLSTYGPLGFHFLDFIFFVQEQNLQLTPETKTAVQNWYKTKHYQTNQEDASPYQNLGQGKNLIVIQVESLQNFVIGKKIDGQEITPNLNKLVKKSLYFPHFYPQTIGGNSSDAELIINTSLFPLEKGSTFFSYPNNIYDSLPLLLKEKGYVTLAIHADEANYWNRHVVYPNLGFEQYYSLENMELTEEIGMGLSDEEMFKQSIPILKQTRQPFYALVITLTSHFPYYVPSEKSALQLPSPLNKAHIGNYFHSINYADYAIGQFMELLKQNGLLENSMVVIFGDHDGLFKRDQDEIEELFARKKISDEEWIRQYLPVPLLIYTEGLQGQRIETYGGQIDFLPTICHLMGVEKNKHPYAMGKNLFTNPNNSVIVPSGDYNKEPFRVSKERISFTLSKFDQDTLKIADLMIKTNFCARH